MYCLFRCFLVSSLAHCLCAFLFTCLCDCYLCLLYSPAYSPDMLILYYFPVLTFICLRASQLLRFLHKPLKGSSTVVKPLCHGKSLVPLLFRYDLVYTMLIFLMVPTTALIKFPRGCPLLMNSSIWLAVESSARSPPLANLTLAQRFCRESARSYLTDLSPVWLGPRDDLIALN